MVDGHLLLSNYFAAMEDTHFRKIEEFPYQLCYCISSYPDLATELELYLLQTHVFREMGDLRFHSDLCGYWRVICSIPGSAAEIVGKYMGSFQVRNLVRSNLARCEGTIHRCRSLSLNLPA